MNRVLQVRLVFAVIGVAIWGYGVASDNDRMRLVGIALLALSLILRWVGRRPQPPAPPSA